MSETVSPILNALNTPFWAAAAEGRLILPACVATGRAFWPPSPVSPFVTGGAVAWREARAEGVLRGVVVYRRVFQKAFERLTPYGAALVELDAGPRLMAHLARPDDPAAPRPGARVRLGFAPLFEGGPAVPILLPPSAKPPSAKTEEHP